MGEHSGFQGPETSRRTFLKSAAAAGAAGALASGMFTTSSWLAPAKAMAEPEERKVCTFHLTGCGGRCPIQCTVRDGRLAMFEPRPDIPDRYQTMCLKGVSELEHLYSEHRVQSPLKLVGERGSGEYVAVSWDEALDDIAARFKEIQAKYGKSSVLYIDSAEVFDPSLLGELMECSTVSNGLGVDIGIANGLEPAFGYGDTVAYATQENRDWVNSKLVLVMGSNFLETSLTTSRTWFEAKEAGARMVVIDPNFSTTASKAHEWVPIRHATDAAFVLGMISVILGEKLYDEDFVRNHTSLPFLVNKKTGKLLRDSEPTAPYSYYTPEENNGQDNPFYVIDGKGAKRYDEVENPVLSGTVEIDGQQYCTAFDLLLENQKPYTTEWAEGITDVPAEKIAEIARLYAEGPSSLVLGWGGNEKFSNADIAGHVSALVAALTGNIGKKGAGIGCYTSGLWNAHVNYIGGYWETGYEPTEEPGYADTTVVRTEDNNIHAIYAQGNFAQTFANQGLLEEWLDRLDFVVTSEVHYSEATRLADYVLPVTSKFEYDGDFGAVTQGYNSVVLQQKVIDPLFEAKTVFTLERELAKRMGISEKYFPKDMAEYNDYSLSIVEDPFVSQLTNDDLLAANGWIYLEGADEPRIEFTDLNFNTASGRMDVYYDFLTDYNQAFPNWEGPLEAYDGNPKRDEYPLIFFNAHSRYRVHCQFHNAKWLDEVFTSRIELNPEDMEKYGLKTGDAAKVYNERGSLIVQAVANPAIRPGTSRMIEGAGSRYLGGEGTGSINSLTNEQVIERGYALAMGPVIPYSDTLVAIEKA